MLQELFQLVSVVLSGKKTSELSDLTLKFEKIK